MRLCRLRPVIWLNQKCQPCKQCDSILCVLYNLVCTVCSYCFTLNIIYSLVSVTATTSDGQRVEYCNNILLYSFAPLHVALTFRTSILRGKTAQLTQGKQYMSCIACQSRLQTKTDHVRTAHRMGLTFYTSECWHGWHCFVCTIKYVSWCRDVVHCGLTGTWLESYIVHMYIGRYTSDKRLK